jgi:HD-GYP domain-containing protein (c-di-GMP phosphodiesterase class II)
VELKAQRASVEGQMDIKSWEIHHYKRMIWTKDPLTCDHCNKAAEYAVGLGEQLCLPEQELEALSWAAILHDLGKVKVPNEILMKPTSLTEEEYAVIKCHPSWGAEMIEHDGPPDPRRKMVAQIVHYHHERYDGWGYPEGLRGERIPYLAQIIAIVDAFDAMTSDRPYRKGMTRGQALEILYEERGKQFNPELVDQFVQFIAA